jgi:hypothetical protein
MRIGTCKILLGYICHFLIGPQAHIPDQICECKVRTVVNHGRHGNNKRARGHTISTAITIEAQPRQERPPRDMVGAAGDTKGRNAEEIAVSVHSARGSRAVSCSALTWPASSAPVPSPHPLFYLSRLEIRLTISRYGRVFVFALFICLSSSIAK